jgi:hypothetical protein
MYVRKHTCLLYAGSTTCIGCEGKMLRVSTKCVDKENHHDLQFGTMPIRYEELLLLVHEKKKHASCRYMVVGNSY